MHLILLRMSLYVILFILACNGGFAQRFSPNPLSLSLGSCSYALDGLYALGANPASLARMHGYTVQSYYRNSFFSPKLHDYALQFAAHFPKYGTTGLFVQRSGFRLFNRNKVSLAYARSFGEHFSMGMNFNYHLIQQGAGYGSLHAFSADLGIQVRFLNKFQWGFAVYNPIPMHVSTLWPEKLPFIVGTGFQYQHNSGFKICMELDKWIRAQWNFRMGIEYKFMKKYYLAVGFHTQPLAPTFGFGFEHKKWRLHWASAYNFPAGMEMALSLAYQWKRK